MSSNSPNGLDPSGGKKKVSFTSLPHKGQLLILCLARLADPLAQTSIQSYMFFQLKYFNPNLSGSAISAQAGLLIGSKAAAQVCTGMLWGRLADAEFGGRKLVLLIGLMTCCISYIGYGLSTSFPMAVCFQLLGGALSSNIAITRCVVAELNPEKPYRVRALLLLPLFANAGSLLGPLVGGFLSSEKVPGEQGLYPYLYPNLFVSGIYLLAALGVLFGLQETLESIQRSDQSELQRLWHAVKRIWKKSPNERHAYTAVSSNDQESPSSPGAASTRGEIETPRIVRKLPFRRIWTFNVLCTMLSHFIITGHLGTFSSLWAIFISTPVGNKENRQLPFKFNGGLGMLPHEVGLAMSLLGGIGVLLQTVVYPLLQDRFGTVQIWRTALLMFPVVYLVAPFPSLAASMLRAEKGQSTALVWVTMSIIMIMYTIGRTGVTPATTLLINDCTPHPTVRGTIHTTGTVVGNLSRMIFPFAALAIYGQGLRIGVVGLGFWCLMALAILACVASLWVTEGSNGKEIDLDIERIDEEQPPKQGQLPR